jgi:small subunit ribosomal protein S20
VAQHKSAAKRARQSEKRRQRNQAVKTRVRGLTKRVRQEVAAGQVEQAEDSLRLATQVINSAASKGVLHKRNAARKVSRLSRQVAALSRTQD